MPWSQQQWRAIAARTMRRKGPVAGRAYLHKLKVEAGGHAVDPKLTALERQRRRKKKKH
jgi:hypothetical protein